MAWHDSLKLKCMIHIRTEFITWTPQLIFGWRINMKIHHQYAVILMPVLTLVLHTASTIWAKVSYIRTIHAPHSVYLPRWCACHDSFIRVTWLTHTYHTNTHWIHCISCSRGHSIHYILHSKLLALQRLLNPSTTIDTSGRVQHPLFNPSTSISSWKKIGFLVLIQMSRFVRDTKLILN